MKPAYVLPSEFFLKTTATRGKEGEVYVRGTTNLPDGLNIDLEIVSSKVSKLVTVKDGAFTSPALYAMSPNPHRISGVPEVGNAKFLDVPFPAGKRQVHYHAAFIANSATSFNAAFQRPEVLALVGNGGKNLKGDLFKETDPDVIDSDKVLDTTQTVELTPLTPEAQAVNLVKRAVLDVPGIGKSSTDIDQNVQYYMTNPGYHRGPRGWDVRQTGDGEYEVSFDIITDDAEGHHQAVWSANLATRQVKIINKAAKYLSWTPNY